MPHQVVHFEIPADDIDRAREFYNGVFGWETTEAPGFPDYYTFDANGNTSEMTDAAAEIVNYYVYEPFGKALQKVETAGRGKGPARCQ